MPKKNFGQKTIDAINNSNTQPEQITFLEGALREQLHKASDHAMKAISSFLLFTAMWWLIKSARMSKVSMFDLEITDLKVLLLMLPILAAFSFYRYQTSIMFVDLVDNALSGLYAQKYSHFFIEGIMGFLTADIFLSIENKMNLDMKIREEGGFLNVSTRMWTTFIALIMSFGPTIILSWISYTLFIVPEISLTWSITTATIVMLFVIRSNMVFVHWMRNAKGPIVTKV